MTLLVHPQVTRVFEIDRRIQTASALAKPETAYMADSLLRQIRSDIVREKPHRLDASLEERARAVIGAHYSPVRTAQQWRAEINARFHLLKAISNHSSEK